MPYVLCCRFTCPICSKSTQDMSRIWERLDQEVYLTPMPEEYRLKKVQLRYDVKASLCQILSRATFLIQWSLISKTVALSLQVWVLCNDCGSTSDVYYHVVGHKCLGCGSYNTRSTSPPSTVPRRADSISSIGTFSGTIESNVSSSIAGSNG